MLKLPLPPLRAVRSLNIAAFFFFHFSPLSPSSQTMQGRACIAAIILISEARFPNKE